MKKFLGVLIFVLILISFGVTFVSAAQPNQQFVGMIQGAGQTIFEIFKPILDLLVGDTTATGSNLSSNDIFLIKIIFMVIVFSISWVVLDKMPIIQNEKWIPYAIAGAVTILSVRFVGDGSVIAAMLFPYSVFGVALTSFLPFLIYFFAAEKITTHVGRKLAWMFFAAVYAFIYFARMGELGEYAFMYLVIAVLSVIILLTDSQIQKIRSKAKIQKIHSTSNRKRAADLLDERDKMTERYHKQLDNYKPIYVHGEGRKAYHEDIKKIDEIIADLENNA